MPVCQWLNYDKQSSPNGAAAAIKDELWLLYHRITLNHTIHTVAKSKTYRKVPNIHAIYR